jgi:hypothetical protein
MSRSVQKPATCMHENASASFFTTTSWPCSVANHQRSLLRSGHKIQATVPSLQFFFLKLVSAWPCSISIFMSYQFSLSLSPNSASVTGYNIQLISTSASATSIFSLSVSTTISDLIILEFIFYNKIEKIC